jgi:hypothetical protein
MYATALTQPGPGRIMVAGVNEGEPWGEDVSRDQAIAVESREAERTRLFVGHATDRTYLTD